MEKNNYGYKCSRCPKQFSRLDTLLNHQRDIHGAGGSKSNIQCLTCLKLFSSRQNLTRHEATHTNSSQYQCIVCAKEFKRADNLKRHERLHESSSTLAAKCSPTATAESPTVRDGFDPVEDKLATNRIAARKYRERKQRQKSKSRKLAFEETSEGTLISTQWPFWSMSSLCTHYM